MILWLCLVELIERHYAKPLRTGRQAIGMERVVRIYILQHGYGHCDAAVEETLYDMKVMRKFAGLIFSEFLSNIYLVREFDLWNRNVTF